MTLDTEVRAQVRALYAREMPRFTTAWLAGNLVPIEACYLLVAHPDREGDVRELWEFISARVYLHHRHRLAVGEIGRVGALRVLIDAKHEGEPKVYGYGDYTLKLAEESFA